MAISIHHLLLRLLAVATVFCSFAATVGKADTAAADSLEASYVTQVQPLLKQYCVRCHNPDEMESGIRVDHLDGSLDDKHLALWKGILVQLSDEAMPPEDELQPTSEQRQLLTDWIENGLISAKQRQQEKNGSVRRLTVAQYRNTLRDLLLLKEDFTDILPPDAVSKDGFLNNGQTMELSPLLVEAYFEIAEKMLDLCIVDEDSKPTIQNLRLDFGKSINTQPIPDELNLGPNNLLLRNDDFVVTQLTPAKPFDYNPFFMRTKYRFNEGYEGNSTVRGWRNYDSIYHAVYACMRGDEGYPKGVAYSVVPEGLLLRPAVPNVGLFGKSTTFGPKANFKVSLRELPDHGNLRVTVKAAKYNDGLLLDKRAPVCDTNSLPGITADVANSAEANIVLQEPGIYQIDVTHQPVDEPPPLQLMLGERFFTGWLMYDNGETPDVASTAFLVVRLPKGPLRLTARYGENKLLKQIMLTRVAEEHPVFKRFLAFEKRTPTLGCYLGLRRDCGSTLSPFGELRAVAADSLNEYIFEDAITNHPRPEAPKQNDNYLAGVSEVGIRSEYTDARDMPRVLIKSVELEGPFYESWPPATHRNIFVDSISAEDPAESARALISSFATRAFRRPATEEEVSSLFAVWNDSYEQTSNFHQSMKDALLVVLTSPQFLFLIENSETPEAEPLDGYELASKLSYFLWNAAPDGRLLELAAEDTLHAALDREVRRMIYDQQFDQFVHEFTSQWLSLDKLDVVEIDRDRYPELTDGRRKELRREPIELIRHLIQHNLSVRNLVQSDFVVVNETAASYYGLGESVESGFEFVPVRLEVHQLGGLLSQAGILAALSDGRESNPIKRGAWLARKIIAEPPADPPPNVPDLEAADNSELTLRARLEKHRDQKGCAKCHSGIDPWGLPLEQYDAGGLFKQEELVDARSTLPDETQILDANTLKSYLANDRLDQVAFSFLKHLATYATGRTLTYNEIEFLKAAGLELRPDGYRMQDMVRFVVNSPLFLEK